LILILSPALISKTELIAHMIGNHLQMYELKFKSRGDSALSQRVVEVLKQGGEAARTVSKLEARGRDGRGVNTAGFDHGVSGFRTLLPSITRDY
jgi:hypothetical protein